jgi:hypothetical protein
MRKRFFRFKNWGNAQLKCAKEHVQDNSGDGYIWFLFMTIVLLLVFGALFTIMATAVNMRDIRVNVDEAASEVFSDIRTEAYDKLTNGSTDFTDDALANNDGQNGNILSEFRVAQQFAEYLGAYCNTGDVNTKIEKLDAHGRVAYSIENLHIHYIDDIHKKYSSGEDGLSARTLGDLSGDDSITELDLMILDAGLKMYAQHDTFPLTVEVKEMEYILSLELCDIDNNQMFNEDDLALLEGLIEYWALYNTSYGASLTDAKNRSSALLMITFDLTVPKRFGTINFGESRNNYAYHSTFSVKIS